MAIDTRERILDTAQELFNAQGLYRVGVRDVARAVGMSPGNLAYHFRTRDDLVAALIMRVHERNQADVFNYVPADFSLVTLYEAALTVMRRTPRFLLLGYADAVAASPGLRELERRMWDSRRHRYDQMIDAMCHNGLVDRAAVTPRRERLYETAEMISSGWLAASCVGRGPSDVGAAMLHYAKLGVALLEPSCTPRGLRQLRAILLGKHDPVAPA